MVNGKRIKIIKRAERRAAQEAALAEKRSTAARHSGDTSKRDAVTVVTEWISELRQKKVAETAQGFGGLFRKVA